MPLGHSHPNTGTSHWYNNIKTYQVQTTVGKSFDGASDAHDLVVVPVDLRPDRSTQSEVAEEHLASKKTTNGQCQF